MKSINTNGLSKSQSKGTNSIVSSHTPTMSNQEINAQVPSVDGLSIGSTNSATSMGIPNPASPLVGNMQAVLAAGIPNITTPNTGTSSNMSGNLPNVSAPDYSDNLVNYIDDVLQEYTLPTVESPSNGIGTQEVQPTDNSAFEAMDATKTRGLHSAEDHHSSGRQSWHTIWKGQEYRAV